MASKRISLLLILLCVVLLLGAVLENLVKRGWNPPSAGDLPDGSYAAEWEEALSAGFPQGDRLRALLADLRYRAGVREQNGILIGERGLMENLQPPQEDASLDNMLAIQSFARRSNTPVYAVLIPTSCAIYQQAVPPFTELFNQKQLIEEMYSGLSRTVSCVDVYSPLFAAQQQYLYYRTDSCLTSLGGYYVYAELARRMGQKPYDQSSFSIRFIDNAYYGDLQARCDYKSTGPDVVSRYEFTEYPRNFVVWQDCAGWTEAYDSLFFTGKAAPEGTLNRFLGGARGILEIESSIDEGQDLLVFGDSTARAWLPFLALHYRSVTFINLADVTGEQLEAYDASDYKQILFAYSTRSFLESTVIPKALRITLPEAGQK